MSKSIKINIEIPSFPYKEIFLLYGLASLLVVVFYFLPLTFRYITFIALLTGFILSKKDYWWIALFFIIYSGPWGLFTEGTRGATVGIPLLSFRPGFSLTFTQLFVLIGLGKSLYRRRPFISSFRNQFLLIFSYFGLLILFSFVMGTSLGVIIDDFKKATFWVLVFVFPALINTRNEIYKFIYLILPITLLVFIDAVYFLSTGGNYLYNLISPVTQDLSLGLESEINSGVSVRYILNGWHAVLIGYIISLALAQIDKRHSLFLYSIAAIAFIIVVISATRSWFVIFLFIAVYTFWRVKKIRAIISMGAVFIFFFYLVLSSSATSRTVFQSAFDRILTVVDISQEGSLSNKAIIQKMNQRLPGQLQLIRQNPITGWGFTENKGDVDVGFFGHWVEVGLIGLILFFNLWYSYLRKTWLAMKNKYNPSSYRYLMSVFWIGFIGLLISHFTTNKIFGITSYVVLISMYFWITDFFLREVRYFTPAEKI